MRRFYYCTRTIAYCVSLLGRLRKLLDVEHTDVRIAAGEAVALVLEMTSVEEVEEVRTGSSLLLVLALSELSHCRPFAIRCSSHLDRPSKCLRLTRAGFAPNANAFVSARLFERSCRL